MATTVDANMFDGPGPEAQFRTALQDGRIQLQQCQDCQRSIFYPRVLCPHCGGLNLEWRASEGAGSIYSFTWVDNVPEGQQPYNICLVDLAEGVRVLSRVDGIEPGSLKIGLPVIAEISTYKDQPIIVFKATDAT
ncbi:MAG: Zn-ribbon domain-containing OB-fold protein [Gammaproteobacteria bacterium]